MASAAAAGRSHPTRRQPEAAGPRASLAATAHEMSNLVGAMQMSLDLLSEGGLDSAAALAILRDNTRDLARLLKAMHEEVGPA